MSTIEEQSVHLSRVLYAVGYNRHRVEIRKLFRKYIDAIINDEKDLRTIVAGSQAEGIGKPLMNDYDYLLFAPTVKCLQEVPISTDDSIVFITHGTQPGYCLLKFQSNQDYLLYSCLIKYRDQVWLGSRRFREICRDITNFCDSRFSDREIINQLTGPAVTKRIEGDYATVDWVFTLSCACPTILEQWLNRPQKYTWPSFSCRKETSNMGANLVATGMKGSRMEDLEWRYCFNEIELLLVSNLNDTLLQLYVTLKMMNKDILRKKDFTLSSFMWKNIVFWIAEEHEQTYFRPENLYSLVIECLERMKLAAHENNLPYYMVPERNLFKEKVDSSDRPRLKKTLSDMIKQGQRTTINSTRLGKFMQLNPGELKLFGKMAYWFELLNETQFAIKLKLSIEKRFGISDHLHILEFQLAITVFLQSVIIMSGLPRLIEEDIMKCPDCLAVMRVMLVGGE